jgi:hypothetical protein
MVSLFHVCISWFTSRLGLEALYIEERRGTQRREGDSRD